MKDSKTGYHGGRIEKPSALAPTTDPTPSPQTAPGTPVVVSSHGYQGGRIEKPSASDETTLDVVSSYPYRLPEGEQKR